MWIYIAKFEKRSGLIKIGMSQDVAARLKTLTGVHGKVVYHKRFRIEDTRHVEKLLHTRFRLDRAEITRCDGFTEFFNDSVQDAAVSILTLLEQPRTPEEMVCEDILFRRDIAWDEFVVRKARVKRLINRLLLPHDAYEDDGSYSVGLSLQLQLAQIYAAESLGFPVDEVCNKAAEKWSITVWKTRVLRQALLDGMLIVGDKCRKLYKDYDVICDEQRLLERGGTWR